MRSISQLRGRWAMRRAGSAANAACRSQPRSTPSFRNISRSRIGIPSRWTWALLRRFHAPASCTMVATDSIRQELEGHGFTQLKRWTPASISRCFSRRRRSGPISAADFSSMLAGSRWKRTCRHFSISICLAPSWSWATGLSGRPLQARYPDTHFVGLQTGAELAAFYALSDVFVFPSLTDTFGLVMLGGSGVGPAGCGIPGTGAARRHRRFRCRRARLGFAGRHPEGAGH